MSRPLTSKDFKDPNTIKCFICGLVPLGLMLWGEAEWIKLVAPKLNMFSADSAHFDPVIIFALAFGMVAPLWAAIRFVDIGLYLGKKFQDLFETWGLTK